MQVHDRAQQGRTDFGKIPARFRHGREGKVSSSTTGIIAVVIDLRDLLVVTYADDGSPWRPRGAMASTKKHAFALGRCQPTVRRDRIGPRS